MMGCKGELAAAIRLLVDHGFTNREIADGLECSIEYVRASRSRHLNRAAWLATSKRQAERRQKKYESDPEFRESYLEYQRNWRRNKREHERFQAKAKARVERLTSEAEAERKVEAAE